MPKGEDDEIAQDLKESLEGQLLSMNRFCLLDNNGIYITEGIVLNDGSVDPSTLLKKKQEKMSSAVKRFIQRRDRGGIWLL